VFAERADRLPTGTELRRRLRLYWQDLTRRRAEIDVVLASHRVHDLVDDVMRRGSGKGRLRALKNLRRLIDRHAKFVVAETAGLPRALWYLVRLDEEGVGVDALILGPGRLVTGQADFVAGDHAQARLVQRAPQVDISFALLDGQVSIGLGRLFRLAEGEDVLVPAAGGAFAGVVEDGGLIRARTFLATDMLRPDQQAWLRRVAEAAGAQR